MIFFYLLSSMVFGLIFGSFLTALTYRMPLKKSVLFGRSFCPKCGKTILWYDNIPLLSFFLLKGRCRSCKKGISLRYPVIELLTSSSFFILALVWLKTDYLSVYKSWFGFFAFPFFAFLIFCLLSIAIVDFEHMIVSDRIVNTALFFVFLFFLASPSPTLFVNFSWACFVSSFLLFLHIITSGRGMGLGDVKLGFLLGLTLGFPLSLAALALAFVVGGVVGLALVVLRKASFGKPIPFGPFLAVGIFFALIFGQRFAEVYKWLLF